MFIIKLFIRLNYVSKESPNIEIFYGREQFIGVHEYVGLVNIQQKR